ncbi:hypothetical protein Psal104b_03537 (plasmid) [Piscirickettsia salmonis]|nr:hypothetical protein Psal104b_03537 [Piscirickettsia salmonis]
MPRAKITKVIVDEYVAGFQIGRPPQTKTAYLAQDLVQGYRDWFRQPDAMIIARSFDQPHSERRCCVTSGPIFQAQFSCV